MQRHPHVSAMAFGLACGSPSAAQQVTIMESVGGMTPADPSKATDPLRFKNDLHNRMTVPVTLAGAGPFRFLVDTGVNRTVVSREVAAKLGLIAGPA